MDSTCSRCQGPRDRGKQRYCKACHAAYMRETRPPYAKLSPEARKKSKARAYANVYKLRGIIAREACFICDEPKAEMHHENYDNPLEVLWLCRPCHVEHHTEARAEMFHGKAEP
jgi:hypothetical protein